MDEKLIESTLKLLQVMTGDEILKVYDLATELKEAGIYPVEGLRKVLTT